MGDLETMNTEIMYMMSMVMIGLVALLEIDWAKATDGFMMNLKEAVLGDEHEVTFLAVQQMDSGAVLATVDSDTLEGDSLWLSGKFGPQNGLLSLLNAAGDGESIEGNTFKFSRIESDNSAGYAYRWQAN